MAVLNLKTHSDERNIPMDKNYSLTKPGAGTHCECVCLLFPVSFPFPRDRKNCSTRAINAPTMIPVPKASKIHMKIGIFGDFHRRRFTEIQVLLSTLTSMPKSSRIPTITSRNTIRRRFGNTSLSLLNSISFPVVMPDQLHDIPGNRTTHER